MEHLLIIRLIANAYVNQFFPPTDGTESVVFLEIVVLMFEVYELHGTQLNPI